MKLERLDSTTPWKFQRPLSLLIQSFTWRGIFGLAYLAMMSGLLYAAFGDWAYDDPFITYRYAQNLLAGSGFVYNPGQYILSTTTPLFAFLLALFGNIWPDLPHLANLIGVISLGLGGLLIWDLAHSWRNPWVGWVGLLLYPIFPLVVTTLGSETPVYLTLCLLTIVLYARKAYAWTAVAGALAALARLDGVLVVLPLGIDYLLRERRQLQLTGTVEAKLRRLQQLLPWSTVGLYCGILGSWMALVWWYFGSPFPATLVAKRSQGTLAISQNFAAGFLSVLNTYGSFWHYWAAAVFAVIGLGYLILRNKRWWILPTWTLLYFIAYVLLGVTSYFWYYSPLVPGFVVLVGLGIAALANSALPATGNSSRSDQERNWFVQNRNRLVATAFVFILLIFQVRDLARFARNPDDRYSIYKEIGQWLDENTTKSESVGALEIGIIGYYAHREMIDFAGLLQPAVAEHLVGAQDYSAAARWALRQYQPDYVVLQADFPQIEVGYLDDHCSQVRKFPGEAYGYNADMAIFACR